MKEVGSGLIETSRGAVVSRSAPVVKLNWYYNSLPRGHSP